MEERGFSQKRGGKVVSRKDSKGEGRERKNRQRKRGKKGGRSSEERRKSRVDVIGEIKQRNEGGGKKGEGANYKKKNGGGEENEKGENCEHQSIYKR